MVNRYQNTNQRYDNRRRGTRSTGVDTLYGNQRSAKETNLMQLTSREFHRHVPHFQEHVMNGVSVTLASKQNGIVAVNNNNHVNQSGPTHTTAVGVGQSIFGKTKKQKKRGGLKLEDGDTPVVTPSCSARRLICGGNDQEPVQAVATASTGHQRHHNLTISSSLQFDLDLNGEVETGASM